MKTDKQSQLNVNPNAMVQILSAFSPTSRNSDIEFDLEAEPSLTQQHMMAECDINNIMARYERTGEIVHINQRTGNFGDYSDLTDYQSSLNIVIAADAAFAALPAHIRARFANDPAKFLDFVNDKSNYDEAIELGLILKPEGIDAPTTPERAHNAGGGVGGGEPPEKTIEALRAEISSLRDGKTS